MMTKQAELKKQAYASNLKSRALSILIYLIDRSNKDLTCFPAIPTMAEQLHISISTVKRALKELVDTGFIQKDSRFRESNRGQTSNLYTLVFLDNEPLSAPEQDNNPNHRDYIEPTTQTAPNAGKTVCKAEHITFETIRATAQDQEQGNPVPQEAAQKTPSPLKKTPLPTKQSSIFRPRTPVHFEIFDKLKQSPVFATAKEKAGQFLPCNACSYLWTGVETSLIPP